MATITTGGSGNWSSTTNNAPWPGGTKPTTGDVVEIAAGHTVTLDEDTATLGAAGIKNVSGSNTSVLDVSGTRTINGCVAYSGTASTGFITIGTGDNLTINYDGGAGTKAVTITGTGRTIVSSGSGALTVSNTGGTAVSAEAGGYAIDWGSSGTATITGAYSQTSTSIGFRVAAGSVTLNGNIDLAGVGYGVYVTGGSFTLNGLPLVSYAGLIQYGAVRQTGGTFVWTGSRSISAGQNAVIWTSGTATTNFTNLVLSNAGNVIFYLAATTLTLTGASFTNTASTGQLVEMAGGKITITGPTLPAANKVLSGEAQFGYAGDLQTPSYSASGGGGVPVFGGSVARRV